MAVSDVNKSEADPPAKETHKSRDKKERPLTKIVIRRLPPGIDQESFLMQVSPVPDYDYLYTVKGDMSLGENTFSRVYINFINSSDVFQFKEKFDNYVFVDQKGHEYSAVVEFASFQKIPRKRKPRPDPKSGTLESDPFYLEFLETLKEQPTQEEKPEFSYQFASDNKEEMSNTPLLEFIRQKRMDKQRIREERRDERRKKELERKKLRDDERKRNEHKPVVTKLGMGLRPSKYASLHSVKEEVDKTDSKSKIDEDKDDTIPEKNNSPTNKTKESKYEEKKPFGKVKLRFPVRTDKESYTEKKTEYKRREDFREKEYRGRRFDEYNKKELENKEIPRKTKKYSEKREERKKAEQKKNYEAVEKTLVKPEAKTEADKTEDFVENSKIEETCEMVTSPETEHNIASNEVHLEHQTSIDDDTLDIKDDSDAKHKNREHDPRAQRRIRNKDRPTMAIYQPGMLSKRKPVDGPDAEVVTKDPPN